MKALLLSTLLCAASGLAGTPSSDVERCCELNLWTGEGTSLGHRLFWEVNYQVAAGSATIDPRILAAGHHDPDRHGITQQAFEVAATLRLTSALSIFGSYSGKVDRNDHWLSEFEEYYATLELPGSVILRGGRLQPRLGLQNELHLHDFDFVDQYLASARMFGEDPLVIYGGEVRTPVIRTLPKQWDDLLSISFGAVPDAEEEGHAHGAAEALYEAEGNLFADWVATLDYRLGFAASESRRYEFGLAAAFGANEYRRHSQVYGVNFLYLWRPEGAEHAGHHHHGDDAEFFRFKLEAFVRHFGAISSPDEHGEEEESDHAEEETHAEHSPARIRDEFFDGGFYASMAYGLPGGRWEARLRGEYVTGVSDAALGERWRVSPALIWRPGENLPFHVKLQYNYDHSPSFGDEHSVWAQFSLTWGDCCAH